MVTSCPYCAMDTAGNHAWNCQLRNPLQIDPPSDEGIEWAKKAIVESLERRIAELEAALEKIRDECGKVCNEYETCTHISCASSHAAWVLADQALSGDFLGR